MWIHHQEAYRRGRNLSRLRVTSRRPNDLDYVPSRLGRPPPGVVRDLPVVGRPCMSADVSLPWHERPCCAARQVGTDKPTLLMVLSFYPGQPAASVREAQVPRGCQGILRDDQRCARSGFGVAPEPTTGAVLINEAPLWCANETGRALNQGVYGMLLVTKGNPTYDAG